MTSPFRWLAHRFWHEWVYGGPVIEDEVHVGTWLRCDYPGCGEYDDFMDWEEDGIGYDETEYP